MSHVILLHAARALLGTPFIHAGRIIPNGTNPGGVDCIGFVTAACEQAKAYDASGELLSLQVPNHYARIPSGHALKHALDKRLMPLPSTDIQPGDIGLFRIRHSPQHVAILDRSAAGVRMLHAYQGARKAAEHEMSDWWACRVVAVYRPIYHC